MAVQQWKTKVLRWHQLTRYYINKWQYDGSKWADRIWYGTGSKTVNAVASVPFMITRSMRAQLEQNGFPAHEISALLPKVAHQLLNDKVAYAQFQQRRSEFETAPQPAASSPAQTHEAIEEIVTAIHIREAQEEQRVGAGSETASTNQIAVVPQLEQEAKEKDRL